MGEQLSDEQALSDEQLAVWRNRYQEARRAGMEHLDACAFAKSTTNIALLRRLVEGGCRPELIARIVL